MVLAYLNRTMDYADLLSLLKIKPHGAPAGNIRLLASLNLNVVYSKSDMMGLETMLQQGHPVIICVNLSSEPRPRGGPGTGLRALS
jgi:hypothetical protein